MRNKNKLLFESGVVTAVVFLLIGLFSFIPFNFHLLDIKEAFKNLDLTDIYFSKLKSTEVQDTSVVIIDIDTMGRSEIAELIELVNGNDPAAIGLDAYFETLKDSAKDAKLKAAFSNASGRLVLGLRSMEQHSGHGEGGWLENHEYFGKPDAGYLNFVGDHETSGTIRYFRPQQEGKRSFAVELLSKVDPSKAKALLARETTTEIINYTGNYNQFIHFDGFQLLNEKTDLEILKGKIVLLGFAGVVKEKMSLEDSHFTPLNEELANRSYPDMYGVVIHANIISMVLREDYINKVGGFWNFVLALVIGLIHVVLYVYFYVKKHVWFHLVAKFSQLITSVLLVGFVLFLMSALGIKFQPGLTLGVILLSVDVLYFYEGFMAYLNKKFSIKSYFIHDH